MDSFADRQIKNQDQHDARLGMKLLTLWACMCAFSPNNPSTRRVDPILTIVYIPTDVLSPALCSDIITPTIWINHQRKIRGKGRNTCFVEKCMFHRENACFDEKCALCFKTFISSIKKNAYFVEKCTFDCEMPIWTRRVMHVSMRNARNITKRLFQTPKKMRNSSENAHLIAKYLF